MTQQAIRVWSTNKGTVGLSKRCCRSKPQITMCTNWHAETMACCVRGLYVDEHQAESSVYASSCDEDYDVIVSDIWTKRRENTGQWKHNIALLGIQDLTPLIGNTGTNKQHTSSAHVTLRTATLSLIKKNYTCCITRMVSMFSPYCTNLILCYLQK